MLFRRSAYSLAEASVVLQEKKMFSNQSFGYKIEENWTIFKGNVSLLIYPSSTEHNFDDGPIYSSPFHIVPRSRKISTWYVFGWGVFVRFGIIESYRRTDLR